MVAQRALPAVIVNPSTPVGARDLRPAPIGRIVVEAARGAMPAFVETGLNPVDVETWRAAACWRWSADASANATSSAVTT